MSKIDLKEYLRNIVELESEIHCQESIIKDAKASQPDLPKKPVENSKYHDTRYKMLEDERYTFHSKYYPQEEKDRLEKLKKSTPAKNTFSEFIMAIFGAVIWGAIAFGILFCFCGVSLFIIYDDFPLFDVALYGGIGVAGILLLISICSFFNNRFTYKSRVKNHKKLLAEAEADFNEKEKDFDSRYEKAELAVAEREKEIEKENERNAKEYDQITDAIKKQHKVTVSEVCKLSTPVAEAKNTLDKLYAADIIYPKYRNMVAMCTIYEYFESGRCDCLEGPNGAYNIFESELRQNIIISKLDQVIENLQYIQQNQFLLYKKLDSIDKKVSSMNNKLHTLIDTTTASLKYTKDIKQSTEKIQKSSENIALTSAISAQYSEIAAKNTEVLKYLTLIS